MAVTEAEARANRSDEPNVRKISVSNSNSGPSVRKINASSSWLIANRISVSSSSEPSARRINASSSNELTDRRINVGSSSNELNVRRINAKWNSSVLIWNGRTRTAEITDGTGSNSSVYSLIWFPVTCR